jgi:hypothetical protein
MAAKTSVFYLTERLQLTSASGEATDTIDLGAYVDVADRQGILVHECDFVFQGVDANGNVAGIMESVTADSEIHVQVTDLNRGDIVFADDRALVASGGLSVDDSNSAAYNAGDLYPDNFGPTSAQGGRIVINDQMYCRAKLQAGTIGANLGVSCTVRIKCSVITLSQKDFMAIALQSTAADN